MMQIGKIEFYPKETNRHIHIHITKKITFEKATKEDKDLLKDALSSLLESFGARLSTDDDLIPCFDERELERRNRAKAQV